MSPKDWFDVINGIIANVIAAAALASQSSEDRSTRSKKGSG